MRSFLGSYCFLSVASRSYGIDLSFNGLRKEFRKALEQRGLSHACEEGVNASAFQMKKAVEHARARFDGISINESGQ